MGVGRCKLSAIFWAAKVFFLIGLTFFVFVIRIMFYCEEGKRSKLLIRTARRLSNWGQTRQWLKWGYRKRGSQDRTVARLLCSTERALTNCFKTRFFKITHTQILFTSASVLISSALTNGVEWDIGAGAWGGVKEKFSTGRMFGFSITETCSKLFRKKKMVNR